MRGSKQFIALFTSIRNIVDQPVEKIENLFDGYLQFVPAAEPARLLLQWGRQLAGRGSSTFRLLFLIPMKYIFFIVL